MKKLNSLIFELANESSQKAWEDFVKLTSNDLHRYICYFLHDSEHASDILQEVYILFLGNKNIFTNICNEATEEIASKKIYAWLYKTARNKSLNIIKKKKNGIAAHLSRFKNESTRELKMPPNFLETKESNEMIKYELSLIGEKQQNLLTLKYYHEKSNAEIASEIKCDINSVPILIDRALAKLKKRLEKGGLTLSVTFICQSLSNKGMCLDLPVNLLPAVFNFYQTASAGGLIIKSIILKGILMKSLFLIFGSLVVCTILFYINSPAQEQKDIESLKQENITKENIKTLNPENKELRKELYTSNDIPISEIISTWMDINGFFWKDGLYPNGRGTENKNEIEIEANEKQHVNISEFFKKINSKKIDGEIDTNEKNTKLLFITLNNGHGAEIKRCIEAIYPILLRPRVIHHTIPMKNEPDFLSFSLIPTPKVILLYGDNEKVNFIAQFIKKIDTMKNATFNEPLETTVNNKDIEVFIYQSKISNEDLIRKINKNSAEKEYMNRKVGYVVFTPFPAPNGICCVSYKKYVKEIKIDLEKYDVQE